MCKKPKLYSGVSLCVNSSTSSKMIWSVVGKNIPNAVMAATDEVCSYGLPSHGFCVENIKTQGAS